MEIFKEMRLNNVFILYIQIYSEIARNFFSEFKAREWMSKGHFFRITRVIQCINIDQ